MPTGFTAALEDREFDVNSWLKEDMIRAMGVCVMLRDEGRLDEAGIRKALAEDPLDNHHQEGLETAKQELATVLKRTPEEWAKIYRETRDAEEKSYDVRLLRHKAKKVKYQAAMPQDAGSEE